MLSFLPKIYMYAKIYINEIEVIDLRKNVTIRRKSAREFSSNRMLIANYFAAEEHLRIIMHELSPSFAFIRLSSSLLIQHMVDMGGGISEVEQRTLRDISEHGGAEDAFILTHTDELSNEQALHKLTMALKGTDYYPPDVVG